MPRRPDDPEPRSEAPIDWRCDGCDKLLGRMLGDRLHIRSGRGDEYLVSPPATATCRGCGRLNALDPT